MEEINYNELFDIEAPAEMPEGEGEKEQEPAAPEEQPEEEKQTPEQNAAFAAARRKAEAERDAAIARAKEEAKAETERAVNEIIQSCGFVDPKTQQPVRTKAEFDAYREQLTADRTARVQRKAGMDEQEFRAFVDSLPDVQAAKRAQAEAERAKESAESERAKTAMDEQLREIAKLNPAVKELKDLTTMDTYPQLYALVQKGNTLLDAYRLANYDALTKAATEKAEQAARNAAQSKQHLGATQQRGAGAVTVPADVKAQYRLFNPDATDAEIQAHYAKYHK